jgi:hypothetical protein
MSYHANRWISKDDDEGNGSNDEGGCAGEQRMTNCCNIRLAVKPMPSDRYRQSAVHLVVPNRVQQADQRQEKSGAAKQSTGDHQGKTRTSAS